MTRTSSTADRRRTTPRAAGVTIAVLVVVGMGLTACGDDESDVNVTTDVTTEVGQTPSGSGPAGPIDTTGGSSLGGTEDTTTGSSTEPTPVRGSVSGDAGGGTTP